jgi:hypothetical protein
MVTPTEAPPPNRDSWAHRIAAVWRKMLAIAAVAAHANRKQGAE